ncbi:MAG: hypothetical protein LW630_02815 [Saprospiraceae bacterium]|jgi:hypothetical protein|nr:hypothetical protein [Saprospiraceae bacterium]
MAKWISWIALFLLLVVVPFGSWYYLKSGLDYRKKALSDLLPKDSISFNLDSLSIFRGNTTVLVLGQDTTSYQVIRTINKQFEKVPHFQCLFQDTAAASDGFNILPQGYAVEDLQKYQLGYLLIDTSAKIRNSYAASKHDVKKLIEHTAIVLPREKESDIELKKK